MARIGWLLLALGLLFTGLAGWAYSHQARFVATAARAEGTVVRLERQRGSKGSTTYAPVVEFQAERQTHVFTSSVSSSPPAYDPGERVIVLYPPGRPDDAMIDSWVGRYLMTLVLGIFATVGLIAGGVVSLQALRARAAAGGDRMQWPTER